MYVGQQSGTEFRQHSWNTFTKLDAEKITVSWNWSRIRTLVNCTAILSKFYGLRYRPAECVVMFGWTVVGLGLNKHNCIHCFLSLFGNYLLAITRWFHSSYTNDYMVRSIIVYRKKWYGSLLYIIIVKHLNSSFV